MPLSKRGIQAVVAECFVKVLSAGSRADCGDLVRDSFTGAWIVRDFKTQRKKQRKSLVISLPGHLSSYFIPF